MIQEATTSTDQQIMVNHSAYSFMHTQREREMGGEIMKPSVFEYQLQVHFPKKGFKYKSCKLLFRG